MSTRPPKNVKGGKSRSHGLTLGTFAPKTDNQERVFESDKNVILNGCAGTGKTFITTYLGLKEVLAQEYERLIYIRSAVSTRNLGHLPGDAKSKVDIYEGPYKDIAAELFSRGDAYEILKQKGLVEFMSTSFLRGLTLRDSVIIIDESQNMSYHELDSIITRIGENCRIFVCGDYFQSDLHTNGLKNFHSVLERMECFDFVEFELEDIVRSGFVKEYLTKKYEVFGKEHVR
jgi:phosphate starvation-inducible PhoH-like protein